MKYFFTFFVFLIFSLQIFSQGSETFELPTLPGSYSDGSFVGDNGVTWNYTQSRNDGGYEITNEGIMLRQVSSSSKLVSDPVSGGIGNFTCKLLKAFTGSGNRQVELFINNVSKGTSIAWDNTNVQTFTVNNIDITGNVVIEIKDITSKQVIIDDISWTGYVASSNDTDSDVDGPVLGFQPDPVLISSLADTDGEATHVFDFNVVDAGTSDGLSTQITQVTIKAGANNDVDWSTQIAGVKLSNDGGTTFATLGVPIISASQIVIPVTSGLDVGDGASDLISLYIYLKTSGLTDNGILEFKVDLGSHGFTANAAGSQFATTLSGSTSNQILIDVITTQLAIQIQPSNVNVGVVMTPSVVVNATDANGNIDTDYSSNVSLSTTGTFDGAATTFVSPSSGVATFSNLIFSVAGIGLTLTANSGALSGVMSNTFDVTTPPAIVINELLADPATGAAGDANGDGVRDGSDDEFVELVNTGIVSLDISGWTLSDGNSVRHTFPNPTVIPVNNSVVIFGGGTPTGIPGIVQTASSGLVGLNNGGDDVIIKDGGGTTIVSYTYGGEGENNQSIARSPDFTGAFVEHSSISSNPVAFSPGRDNTDGAALPIILTSFTATKKSSTTLLQWQTATEINNDYMAIERSSDGRTFAEIGRMQGAGTSHQINDYSFVDEKPNTGINYYRLRQVDYDGRAEIHRTVSVFFGGANDTVQVFPTEAANEINVIFAKTITNKTQLIVVDVTGKEWLSTELGLGQSEYILDVSSLVAGQFFLRIQSETRIEVARFMKL